MSFIWRNFLIVTVFMLSLCSRGWGGKVLVEDNVNVSTTSSLPPKVGRSAAQKYFVKDHQQTDDTINTRLLSLHIGGYIHSKASQWGDESYAHRVGGKTMGVTYKIGEWVRTMDLNLRIDYFQYELGNEKPIKVSFVPLMTFPDASTNFPLYFGLGAGMGFFLNQLERESNLSMDYQLIFGVRWTDLWNHSGIFIESGIKDHVHLLSDGKFTSQFLTAGAVFKL